MNENLFNVNIIVLNITT